MKQLIADLIGLVIGMFLYEYMIDGTLERAIEHSYFAVFGGIFVYIRTIKLAKEDTK